MSEQFEFWNWRKLSLSLPNEEHIEAFIRDAEDALESADTDPGWGEEKQDT